MHMLKIENLNAGYDDLKVLFDVNFEMNEGEIVALVGSNGAGKTTLLRIITGALPIKTGKVEWYGKDLTKIPPYKQAEMGIAHIPQGRGILGTLSIKDNLFMGTYNKRTKTKRADLLAKTLDTFPILKTRLHHLAGTLSGGQQQMLAIGRAMMMEPKLLILDEPSLGLAPIIVNEVFEILQTLKGQGVSMLLIEQNLVKALELASRGYVLETGRVELQGESGELLKNPAIRKAYLGI
ncbi:ABC transporter ATP-binding protein [Ruminococcaceae bacterium OttesenSCG-928-A16]|nr:ABC transporter ATP-binding protein [Ruminococcaceae bacterium OttesenSCG-928-A16]